MTGGAASPRSEKVLELATVAAVLSIILKRAIINPLSDVNTPHATSDHHGFLVHEMIRAGRGREAQALSRCREGSLQNKPEARPILGGRCGHKSHAAKRWN